MYLRITKLSEYLPNMKLDLYSFKLQQESWISERKLYNCGK